MSLIGGAPFPCGITKMFSARILRADHWIFRFRFQPDCACEFRVIHPMPQHELILILDAGVNEIAEKPALNAIVGLGRIVNWARRADRAGSDGAVLLLPPGSPWPVTGWPRGLTRRMCAPTGQRSPLGSPDPSAFTYPKLFSCSGESPPAGLSVSGDNSSGVPLRHRPQILAAEQLGIDLVFVRLQKILKSNHVCLDHLEDSEAAIQAKSLEAPARNNSQRPSCRTKSHGSQGSW